MSVIINGDCLEELKNLPDESVDTVITDPPYGYSFMGKNWDKAVPSVEIWQECLRVLKPGAFACVMSAPRSDVQQAMTERLIRAGFRLDFTPIYWTYASGFPKAGNVGKLVDKRLGAEREVVGIYSEPNGRVKANEPQGINGDKSWAESAGFKDTIEKRQITQPATSQAKALDGSYAGFQPKPAVEVVIVAMKPLSEKTYVDQALKNGKGVTWLDDCRVPTDLEAEDMARGRKSSNNREVYGKYEGVEHIQPHQSGRFPANLVVSDETLEDYSRFFNLDKWYERINDDRTRHNEDAAQSIRASSGNAGTTLSEKASIGQSVATRSDISTLPFLIVPKASKSEKNKGLEHMEAKQITGGGGLTANVKEDGSLNTASAGGKYGSIKAKQSNFHPTVKPLKLMSYLITLFSREGDTVLDPFVGSGTTVVAAEQLGRKGIGIEREAEYAEIARARLAHIQPLPEEPESVPPITMDEVLDSKPSKRSKPEQMRLL